MPLRYLDSDILQYIVDKKLVAGDRLPSLTELSDELDISVSKLREQLEVARCLEIVGVKPGAGTQINEFDFAATMRIGLSYSVASSRRNFEAYTALRNGTVAAFWVEAVSQLTSKDLAEIRSLLISARAKLHGEHIEIPHPEHRAFHLALLKWLDNPFVTGIEEAYWMVYEAVELNRLVDYQYLVTVWDHHEQMVDHIEDRKFEASRDIFVKHTQLLKLNHANLQLPVT